MKLQKLSSNLKKTRHANWSNIRLRIENDLLPSLISPGSSFSLDVDPPQAYFHYLLFRLLHFCSAFLPWWVFCRAALCWKLLTSSRNFLFPLTHLHIHTCWHAHMQSCCCLCYKAINQCAGLRVKWSALAKSLTERARLN